MKQLELNTESKKLASFYKRMSVTREKENELVTGYCRIYCIDHIPSGLMKLLQMFHNLLFV